MITYENRQYDEERALYGINNAKIRNCKFDGPADGESALKECSDIIVEDCFFNLRYPFWHVNKAVIKNSQMTELCRAALWYDEDITISNCSMNGIKALRECRNIKLLGSSIVSPEFLWRCSDIVVEHSKLESEYPFFECSDVSIEDLNMKGKYSFQYVENMTINNSVLDTKDAFWHSKNVTVMDSVVKGEYLGWYSENLRFVRCHIVGTQPLCYCKNLILEDCTMEATDLCFERSEVNASVRGRIESVKNPVAGQIKADEIGEIIMEEEYVDSTKTQIIIK
ncbi:MAG: DUF3737 family protein [Agathobacter sp.]|nr:DUF3737 family protein [Agathobacter sp.]MDY3796219.1 DUF3737 family protein [Agathobacter sp.]